MSSLRASTCCRAEIAGEHVRARSHVPTGHKIATVAIGLGEAVRKYGQILGFANAPIAPGDHVDTHNVAMGNFARDYAFGLDARATQPVAEPATFQGIVRADGRVATRNYLGVLTTVNCSASAARFIAEQRAMTRSRRPVVGGANIVCFTTGRGSVFGCEPAPSLKLATNTPLFRRMEDDMDIDCGPIADGEATVEDMGRRIFDLVLATASGRKSKSELLGFGEDEFTPWVLGAVM